MKVDKEYCMSSYLTFRYVARPDTVFKEGMPHVEHECVPDNEKQPCRTADDIDKQIRNVLSKYDLSHASVFLSGGMDSAILASYLPKGAKAYTARCVGAGRIDETERAAEYCRRNGLEHVIVDVSWEDCEDTMDKLMRHDGCPIIPNEPQAYMLALKAKEDGSDLLVYGDCADTEFGGMTKLLSRDWDFDGFVDRFTFLNPKKVLKKPADVSEVYEKYKVNGNGIDFVSFIGGPYAVSAAGALTNAMDTVGIDHVDPYEHCCLAGPLDLARVRRGDSKYLIRDLFRMKYPGLEVPEKLPMSRPADAWLADWEGPTRDEFIPGCVKSLTGEQKLLLYSLERFLNLIGA